MFPLSPGGVHSCGLVEQEQGSPQRLCGRAAQEVHRSLCCGTLGRLSSGGRAATREEGSLLHHHGTGNGGRVKSMDCIIIYIIAFSCMWCCPMMYSIFIVYLLINTEVVVHFIEI